MATHEHRVIVARADTAEWLRQAETAAERIATDRARFLAIHENRSRHPWHTAERLWPDLRQG